jgi:uroporphyrinogen decarboxylase
MLGFEPRKDSTMNKREMMLSLLTPGNVPPYVPAAFFLHFGEAYREGPAAIDRHLAYFRHTGMDFVKIQYEHAFPYLPEIRRPEDWRKMPLYGDDFYAAPLAVVEGLVQAAKHEALVLVTLYSPFMSAGHTTSGAIITEHLRTDPEAVRVGLEIITESLLSFVRGCIGLGVDGFYASTQGGEAHRFTGTDIFASYVKPYDLVLMNEINAACPFNILHVCDYCGGYEDLAPFLDYPGDVVNCSLALGERSITPQQASAFFGRPFMGGVDRHGAIASGDRAAIRSEVAALLEVAPERYILGADCTVPGDTDWDALRVAVEAAHGGRG